MLHGHYRRARWDNRRFSSFSGNNYWGHSLLLQEKEEEKGAVIRIEETPEINKTGNIQTNTNIILLHT